jgi:ubiquinone/menaquinone biosynthesis C-methylase UbiE
MDTETAVARHYSRPDIETALRAALLRAGKDPERLSTGDLAAVDEFHLGWLPATAAIAESLRIGPGMRVLDIGAGLGGPARHFASRGATVEGIDLAAGFVAVARWLTNATGLSDRAAFHQGSALALPFEGGRFDLATMIHVGMNVAAKPQLFAEAARALRPGGAIAVFDVMRKAEGELPYPMPWADGPETSYVETPAAYRAALEEAGFRVTSEEDRSAFALEIAAAMRARAATEGLPLIGLHLVIGEDARERVGRLIACVERGLLAAVLMVATRG